MRIAAVILLAVVPLTAQWLHYPTPGVPRLPNGKPNLGAPAPRTAGHPDLSGIWQLEPVPCGPGANFAGLSGAAESLLDPVLAQQAGEFLPHGVAGLAVHQVQSCEYASSSIYSTSSTLSASTL